MPTEPSLWMRPGMMPIFALPGEMTPGQLGPTRRDFEFFNDLPDLHHVERRDALCNTDDECELCGCGLENCIRCERWRYEDDGSVRASLAHRVFDGIEDGPALVGGAALARRHAADDLGAVLRAALGVEGSFRVR